MTNAEHIRAMSDEELADLLSKFCENADDCGSCPLLGRCPIVYLNISNDTKKDFEEWLELEARP